MKQSVDIGRTDYGVLVFIPDPASTDGSGKTGLVAANLTASFIRYETDNDVTITDVTGSLNNLAALTTVHTDWGILEVSSTLAPGLYRLDIADAVFATGAFSAVVYIMITTSAAAASPMEFVLEIAAGEIGGPVKVGTGLNDHKSDASANVTYANTTGALETTAQSILTAVDTEVAAILGAVDSEVQSIITEMAKVPKSDSTVILNTNALASIADAILDRNMASGADSGNDSNVRTVRQALRVLRNHWFIAGTLQTFTKEDDTTVSHTSVLAGTPGADPVTSSNPPGP